MREGPESPGKGAAHAGYKMIDWEVRVLNTLDEDQGSVPGHTLGSSQALEIQVLRDPMSSSALLRHLHSHGRS